MDDGVADRAPESLTIEQEVAPAASMFDAQERLVSLLFISLRTSRRVPWPVRCARVFTGELLFSFIYKRFSQ